MRRVEDLVQYDFNMTILLIVAALSLSSCGPEPPTTGPRFAVFRVMRGVAMLRDNSTGKEYLIGGDWIRELGVTEGLNPVQVER